MRRFSSVRVAAVSSVLACVLALVSVVPASATSRGNSNPNNYLALGDSVPFGYNPLLVKAGVDQRLASVRGVALAFDQGA